MEQIIDRGQNDAMEEIHNALKALTVLNEKKAQLNSQIELQQKTEGDLENETLNMRVKLDDVETKAQLKGLSLDQQDHEDELYTRHPDQVEALKKKIEKHSIQAIRRKFFTKISKQQQRLQEALDTYNTSVDFHKKEMQQFGEESELSKEKITINNHPLMKEITHTLNELKGSLPKINSKLSWEKPRFFKSRRFQSFKRNITNRSRTDNAYENGSRSEDTRKGYFHSADRVKNEYDGKFDEILK